jgi:hypothetical protein
MKSNYMVKYAVHPGDFKIYDTSRTQNEFLIKNQ